MADKKKAQISISTDHGEFFHKVKDLPQYEELQAEVKQIIQSSSYWERYGYDLISIFSAVPLHFIGLLLCRSDNPFIFGVGFLILGLCYGTLANRGGHLAIHNALFQTEWLNTIASLILIEVNGFFSLKVGSDIHIKLHHPYTNIIGLGDSSSWKAPALPRFVYMFVAPLTIPVLSPLLAVKELLPSLVSHIPSFLLSISCGLAVNIYLLMKISGFTTMLNAFIFLMAFRSVTSIPYIHVNVFQHIGLPMYAVKDRPRKIYQMSTGVLNLGRNIFLDWVMGHNLVHCHIEHHLFPKLSDTMALKIRPVVKRFLEGNGLIYHEKSYSDRVSVFLQRYEELMVNAPPITHFIGLQ